MAPKRKLPSTAGGTRAKNVRGREAEAVPPERVKRVESENTIEQTATSQALSRTRKLRKVETARAGSGKTESESRAVKEEEVEEEAEEEAEPSKPTSRKKARKTPLKSSIAAKKAAEEIKAFKTEQAIKKAAEKATKEEKGKENVEKKEGDEAAEKSVLVDPEADDKVAENIDAVKREAARPPPVNSARLPLPWKGRLGYACLNTYLRHTYPPIFSSRTCRVQSILDHRHPLADPTLPEHATKNRPDKNQPPDDARGMKYVQELGLQNVRDIAKMLRWNEKYGIRFMRLSSEMFPFASHETYGYSLNDFACEALEEAGRVAGELGHRLSTHPGQFTQLGSPRAFVIENTIRDLIYHDELLSLLRLPPQQDRDAVMVLHLGGTFGDKEATMLRFKENYLKLPPNIKKRLVLENDDVAWSAHDLLPLCEELNIPLVLDFHHNNIIFDSSQIREGTKDITDLYPRIKATWERKHMTWKMHYSEPTNDAITGRQRRCHNRRPSTLPPCPNDMDLMIEAKDKEQAVFDLMRNFKLPGWDSFNNIIPYERDDDNRPAPKKPKKKKTKKQIKEEIGEFGKELSPTPEEERSIIPEEEVGMGGPLNRVYWPEGMDEWLRPKKREVKKKIDEDDLSVPTPYNFPARLALKKKKMAPLEDEARQKLVEAKNIADMETLLEELKAPPAPGEEEQDEENVPIVKKTPPRKKASMKKGKAKFPARKRKRAQAPSDEDGESLTEELGLDYDDADVDPNLEQRSRKRS